MSTLKKTLKLLCLGGAVLTSLTLLATTAHADRERRERALDELSPYAVEFEPHFAFGPKNVYGNSGLGGGFRLSIPIAEGHLGRVPDNLALSFGGDLLHYDNCYYGTNCGANYLLVPVAFQWNIFIVRSLSIFPEAGLFLYKGWLSPCGLGDGPGCSAPSDFGVQPTFALGGRLHVGDTTAITARVGYPTVTIGLSFF